MPIDCNLTFSKVCGNHCFHNLISWYILIIHWLFPLITLYFIFYRSNVWTSNFSDFTFMVIIKINVCFSGPIASYTATNEDYSKHKQILIAEKTSIEDGLRKLNKEKLLNISCTFVENRIFDLNGIEEILHCIITEGERRTAGVFTQRVIENTEKGSFNCFIHCLKQYKTNNDMMRLYETFQIQLGQGNHCFIDLLIFFCS